MPEESRRGSRARHSTSSAWNRWRRPPPGDWDHVVVQEGTGVRFMRFYFPSALGGLIPVFITLLQTLNYHGKYCFCFPNLNSEVCSCATT